MYDGHAEELRLMCWCVIYVRMCYFENGICAMNVIYLITIEIRL